MRFVVRAPVLVLALLLAGCGEKTPATSCGYGLFGPSCGDGDRSAPVIPVITQTTGVTPDPDGYQVRISRQDCTRTTHVAVNATRWLESCGQGTNTVELRDVAPNCTVVGPAVRQVEVPEVVSAEVRFEVQCS